MAAPDWAALTRLAERVDRELVERVRPAERGCVGERLREAVLALARALPDGSLDHEARRLLEFTLALEEAIGADPDGRDARAGRPGRDPPGRRDRPDPPARAARRAR